MAEKKSKLWTKVKENSAFQLGVHVFGTVAKIGAAAAIGLLLKKQDYSDLSALKKACVGVGTFALAAAAGEVAKNAMEQRVEEDTETACVIIDTIQGNGSISIDDLDDEAEMEAAAEA